jgi:orotidine-5'-phosphate decarboxylase
MPVAGSKVLALNARERLIFALDVPTLAAARDLIHKLDGTVSFFKIGIELYAASGLSLVPELMEQRKRVFLDLKFFDVPETVKRAVERVASLGVTFLTVHGNTKIIEAAVQGRGNSDLKLLAVTVLTSLDQDDMKDLGFECSVQDLVIRRAARALEAGCDGVISSPREADKIRELARLAKKDNKFLIVTPGVRPKGSSTDDHKRLAHPADAIDAGADYLVVGRPIREAADPQQVASEIIKEMQAAFASRNHA